MTELQQEEALLDDISTLQLSDRQGGELNQFKKRTMAELISNDIEIPTHLEDVEVHEFVNAEGVGYIVILYKTVNDELQSRTIICENDYEGNSNLEWRKVVGSDLS